jgi:hypothetical protein
MRDRVTERAMRIAVNPEAIGAPECRRCERVMRLVGIERDPDDPHLRLQTFACACGELAVSRLPMTMQWS